MYADFNFLTLEKKLFEGCWSEKKYLNSNTITEFENIKFSVTEELRYDFVPLINILRYDVQ